MNKIIVMTCLVLHSLSVTRVVSIKPNSRILQYSNKNDGSGLYSYSFTTSDDIKREEHSSFALSQSKNKILVVTGSYSYVGPDGSLYEVQYIADENGFRPIKKYLPIYHSEETNQPTALLKSSLGQVSRFDGNDAPIPKDNIKNMFRLKL